jgi:hypothetical protein
MLLSEYIADLTKILDEYGDLPCYYAKDDEGNCYVELYNTGSVYYTTEPSYTLDAIFQSKEEYVNYMEECGEYDNSVELFPICVVN